MSDDDSLADNLFARLFSYTPRSSTDRQKREPLEDFCTEALAWCLRNSDSFRSEFFTLVKRKLGKKGQKINLKHLNRAKVETQVPFKHIKVSKYEDDSQAKGGRFDLVVSADITGVVLIFENKVNSNFGDSQIPKYRAKLKLLLGREKQYKQGVLLTLTKYAFSEKPSTKSTVTGPDATLLWSEVYRTLQRASREGVHKQGVLSTMKQFEEFLKFKGMYFMKIPKTKTSKAFTDGIQFCDSIRQILILAAQELNKVRGRKGSSVNMKDFGNGKGIWLGIGDDKLYLGFKIIGGEPRYELCVELTAVKKPKHVSLEPDKNMKCRSWGNGFGIYGSLEEQMNGNADAIREWFVEAARKALEIRKKSKA